MAEYIIDGHKGVWELKNSYVTDNGTLMIRFYNRDRGVFMNINSGVNLNNLLRDIGAKRISEETNDPNLDIIY